MKTYTTKQGDMWDAIAYRQCGSTNYTDRLMQLNMKYCGLFTFPAGIVLVLPEDRQYELYRQVDAAQHEILRTVYLSCRYRPGAAGG
uniref:Tail protein n=1 Tax=Caudovirales sp. ctNZz8 TaxID=2826772 RepID=A0A8S5QYH6_9CAUD|nr:MAG TPA: tail protein [Caudovirales sp. ctNZz8]